MALKDNKDFSSPKQGMNTDTHSSELKDVQYSFALNANYEDESGNGYPMLQNEHSNILCNMFDEGYQVLGLHVDIVGDKTYYFLVNPDTNCSEIGVIKNTASVENIEDVERECGCSIINELSEPLENQTPTETCAYEVLINDCDCDENETGERCLNFDINYPISSELKRDKAGDIIYFTDDLNPRRRIELSNLAQYFTETVLDPTDSCGTTEEDICLNCERMLVQPPYNVAKFKDIQVTTGGFLKHGIYSFTFCYTDKNGNKMTRYMSLTREIPINDPNKTIYQQPELDARTNLAIKLELEDLDIRYEFYKIAAIQITSVDGSYSVFEVGTFPTSQNKAVYSNEESLQRIPIDEIAFDFPVIKTARTVEAINNKLFFSDLTTQPEINLQPIVNFLGQFVKWRTYIAEEDLYSRPELVHKFKQYTRDEVYPLSIRFFTDDYVTANFPLISRLPTDNDLYFDLDGKLTADDLPESVNDLEPWQNDVYSVLRSNNCDTSDRKFKWQFYNTAEEEKTKLYEECGLEVPTAIKENVTLTRFCSEVIADLALADYGTDGEIVIDNLFGLDTFTTLNDFIKYIYATGNESEFPLITEIVGSLNCDDCDPDSLFPPLICDNLQAEPLRFDIFGILEEGNGLTIELTQECDDRIPRAPKNCYNINTDGNGDKVDLFEQVSKDDCQDAQDDSDEESVFWEFAPVVWENWDDIPPNCRKVKRQTKRVKVWERTNSPFGGDDCTTADTLTLDVDPISTHIVPFYFTDVSDALTTYESGVTALSVPLQQIRKCKFSQTISSNGVFNNNIAINALWFKIDSVFYKNHVSVAMSGDGACPSSKKQKDCLFYSDQHRYTIYAIPSGTGCTPTNLNDNIIHAAFFDREDGFTYCVELDNLDEDNYDIYIAVDTPLLGVAANGTWQGEDFDEMGYTTATCGCINIQAKNSEIEVITLSDLQNATIKGEKVCEYTKECDIEIIGDITCDPVPWSEGKFSYWESTEKYPDNKFLYDSSSLLIRPEDFTNLDVQEVFEDNFTNGINLGEYELNNKTDFSCKPIRHFRFPDEEVSPHIDGDLNNGGNTPFSSNKIFPLGFHIDNSIINDFLDIAVRNGLIDADFRNRIKGYELFTGDIRVDQSVLGKGILVDTYKYKEDFNDQDIFFPNFPYNQLGLNNLIHNNEERTDPINHPFSGSATNNRFVFHSPEYSFNKPFVPFETHIKGYLLGNSRGRFSEVQDHPQMVLLSRKAENLARALAITDFSLETTIFSVKEFVLAGTGGFSTPVALGLATAATVAKALTGVFEVPVKRFEWEKIIYEFGNPNNFASYYSSEGHYNSYFNFATQSSSLISRLRLNIKSQYLKNGRYRFTENDFTTNDKQSEVVFNNYNRESSLYLSFGINNADYASLIHPSLMRSYDTSRFTSSEAGLCNEDKDNQKTSEEVRSIANPYATVKIYQPAQHGTIDAVTWLSTGYTSFLDEDNSCDAVFGGDSFISRFTYKQKFPFFINPMIDGQNRLADRTAFNYEEQRNVGYPSYYVKYKTKQENTLVGLQLPPIQSEYNLDCNTTKRMYVKPPSKFYLSYYGIPSFLVESKINLNFRYGRNSQEENFYPNAADYTDWTQENLVSIKEDNKFYYWNTYSQSYESGWYATRKLPFNYNPTEWAQRSDFFDRVISSIADENEQDTLDNWRVYLARDFYNFGSQYGRLIGLKSIESQKVLGRFEDGIVIFNTHNTLAGSVEDIELGQGNIFKTRPTEFYRSDLGHGGTQHTSFVSCQFGHFWTDAKRGRIYKIGLNGEGLEEISSFAMRNWFRENLPFKIKKQFPDIPLEMLDNSYKGIGITMTWDDRFNRLFVTKKDVKLKSEYVSNTEIIDREFVLTTGDRQEIIQPTNSTYFEDVSWTIAYSPLTKSWISYYSFLPNYYVSQMNYFQSGINFALNKGVYSHLLTNKSFQVFYGDRYPFQVEFPIQNKFVNKLKGSVGYWLDVKRYHNEYDFSNNNKLGFDRAWVYGDSENTGNLNLVRTEQNNLFQQTQFPRFNNNSIDILFTAEERKHSFNYIFDNVKDKFNNVPVWLNNINNVGKSINNDAISYLPTYKNHLKGDWIKVLLSQDNESRYKYIVKWFESNNKLMV